MTGPLPAPIGITEFDALLERVRRLAQQVHDTVQQIVDSATRAIRLLPPLLTGRVVDLIAALTDISRRLFDLVDRLSAPAGRPGTVWATGRRWVEEFGHPLSDHVSKIDPDHLAAGYEWEGRAAEAYEAAAGRQREALAALQSVSADMNLALGRIAIGICGLWAVIAAVLASALVQLVGASVAAGSGVGTPAAVMLATTSVATACAGIAGGAGAFAALVEWVSDSIGTLDQRLHDNSAFPDGAWPAPSAARFEDGSMTDGSPSGWRLEE